MSITAETVRQKLNDAGYAEHADAVLALLQPSIRITATALASAPEGFRHSEEDEPNPDAVAAMESALDGLALGASRFGGIPDLPPGAEWPERDGVPMEFIAQIRLADAAPLDPAGRLPATGSLLFFQNSQWDTHDMEPDAACSAVLYHDGPDTELVRATPPRVEWKSPYSGVTQIAPMIHGLAALELTPAQSLPGGVSPYITGAVLDFWQDFQGEHLWELASAGYPDANFLLGYVDEQDYVDAHANGTEDQLLLQVDSCDAAEFQFGDCQKLFFLLTKEELAARDFSNVRLYSMLG